MRHVLRLALACAVAIGVCAMPSTAAAQAVTGTLLGNVTDSSGGAVPGVTVTATEAETNVSRTTVTTDAGRYIFSSLVNGRYTVTAELQGFKKVVHQNIKVDVNTTIRVDMVLEVGAMTEAVQVTAETPVLQTDRTDTGRIIESKMVTDLPLTFNRNFQSLLITVPGSTRPHREHSQFFNSQDSLRFEVNGQAGMASNTLIEGLDDNHKTGLLQVIIPAADALETVAVTTSNYDAEFGRSGGAITNVTIKSGTNQFKGSVFMFGNNEKTNAGDYFNHQKAPTKFLNTGFTLGGPIVRNKLFFFGAYQRTIDNNGYIIRATVPTALMRQGNFSEFSNGIYDPLTGAINGAGRTAFEGNIIPANRISPIAQRLLAFIPMPNIPGAAVGQNNFTRAMVRERTTDGIDAKVNHTLNQRDQLSYRFNFMRPVVFDDGLYGIYGGPANGGFAGTGTNNSSSTAVTWTRVFSAKTVMDVRGGLNYYRNITETTGAGLTTSTEVGIRGANLNEFTSGISQITLNNGFSNPALGFSNSQPWDRWEKTYNVAATITRMMTKHTLKFGGEYRNNTDMLLQTQDAGGPRGEFVFNANGTANPADAGSTSSQANSFAAFLLDWPQIVRRDLKVFDEPGTRHTGLAAFVHDKWQARSNVTVDLGLRWEFYTPLVGIAGKGGLANYDPATHTINVAGYGAFDNALNVKKDLTHFSPRTGVSWRIGEKSVVRAGYGASTIPFPDNRFAFNYPVKQNYNGTAANGFQAQGSMAAGFPAPALLEIPATGIIPIAGTSLQNATLDVIPTGLTEGTLHSWNVAYQRQLPFFLSADIAYVGNRGVDLVMDVDRNASLVYNSGNNGRPQFATFNRTGTSRERTNLGKSTYHGLQMKIDRRFRQGVMITNSYTLSRAMNYVDENGGINSPIDFSKSWGRAGFGRTHVYTLTTIYDLPFGPGRRWLADGLASKVIGGWQFSTLFVAQSGAPLTITANGTALNTPGTTAFANVVGTQRVLGGLGPGRLYFDPAAYAQPTPGTQGNMSRNSAIEGPGFWQLDAALFKRFTISGTKFAEFRVDAFNVTNSVRWGNPNTGFSVAPNNTFGQVTGTTGGQRSLRFGGRFAF
ncbi:MAG TPA: carboxypeptidase regulatory-like domain-containing protein [Vicinamibacterales bacterium]|nr:carboxypeptidase regulatory-like domain-containing protein [Vicinamibacterales bacterium]